MRSYLSRRFVSTPRGSLVLILTLFLSSFCSQPFLLILPFPAGAQKVQANFSQIESAAQLADLQAEKAAADSAAASAAAAAAAKQSAIDAALASEAAAASARLAYQDEAKTDAAFKKLDAKKATQVRGLLLTYNLQVY